MTLGHCPGVFGVQALSGRCGISQGACDPWHLPSQATAQGSRCWRSVTTHAEDDTLPLPAPLWSTCPCWTGPGWGSSRAAGCTDSARACSAARPINTSLSGSPHNGCTGFAYTKAAHGLSDRIADQSQMTGILSRCGTPIDLFCCRVIWLESFSISN